VCKKIDYKFSTVCEENEKMLGPLGGFFDSYRIRLNLNACLHSIQNIDE